MTAPVRRRAPWVRFVVVAVVLVVAGTTGGLWWYTHRAGVTFSALFSESVGVYAGSDVRILGVPVGAVDSVTPEGTKVKITMHLDPGYNAAADTDAVIISPNLVSDRYVQLTQPFVHGDKLRSGTTLGLARTRTPVELDELYRSLVSLTTALGPTGANKHGALNRLLVVGAANLAGTGEAFNTTIRNLAKANSTLNGSSNDVFATIDNLSSFTSMLEQNNSNLVTVNNELASVTQTLADDRQSFAAAMHELASALRIVQKFVHDNRDALSSSVTKLNAVAQTLAKERASLEQALRSAPLLVQNFINTYDPTHNVIRGRGDLNELTVWSSSPPALLPGTGSR